MTPEDVTAMFEPWRVKHLKPAWIPMVSEVNKIEGRSFFGGTPTHSTIADWPACKECQQPMQFFLQLDFASLPEGYSSPIQSGLLQFFYCSTDDGMCETWAHYTGTHDIRVVEGEGAAITRPAGLAPLRQSFVTGWDQIQDAPHPEDQEQLGLTYQYDFQKGVVSVRSDDPPIELKEAPFSLNVAEAIGEPAAGDKLGGWPFWVQTAEYPDCQECGAQMALLLQIDSDNNVDHMFGDVGCGHITQCPQHPHSLAFGWACG